MISNVNLYISGDRTKVVTEGDPEAASLLVNAGRDIPDAEIVAMGEGLLSQARHLGKGDEAQKKQQEPTAEDKAADKVENKSIEAPMHTKGSGARSVPDRE